jgi:hypothetical protein
MENDALMIARRDGKVKAASSPPEFFPLYRRRMASGKKVPTLPPEVSGGQILTVKPMVPHILMDA